MVETIQGNGLWHVYLSQKDLIEQAGLNEEDFETDFTHFRYRSRRVIISHIYNKHLVVSMEGKEDDDLKNLMDSFSKVVEYQPFCKYTLLLEDESNTLLPTYEWDKVDSNSRYKELQKKNTVENLVKI